MTEVEEQFYTIFGTLISCGLTDNQVEILLLTFWCRKSNIEIAKDLGISHQAVFSSYHAGLEKCKKSDYFKKLDVEYKKI